ncbi:hypothetical protein EDD18DRAFT_1355597 [Armillaria luteobubalina]|uniref:Uncharacterized protein n=1 Tax=Armillaria luteobubalina TaxID=153913 RepID=A0AA39Q2V8_9AGAR|nr:hypothetical protein EDD18DRAFT_1355597 [Armillaria luteobubalina]
MRERQVGIWDIGRGLVDEKTALDQSAGVVMPFWSDNNILFLAGKGDGNIHDALYLGLKACVPDDEMSEFMDEVSVAFPKLMVQSEDFSKDHGFTYFEWYRNKYPTNDDIQGLSCGKLQHKKYFSCKDYKGSPMKNLLEIIDYVKPTALLGLSTISAEARQAGAVIRCQYLIVTMLGTWERLSKSNQRELALDECVNKSPASRQSSAPRVKLLEIARSRAKEEANVYADENDNYFFRGGEWYLSELAGYTAQISVCACFAKARVQLSFCSEQPSHTLHSHWSSMPKLARPAPLDDNALTAFQAEPTPVQRALGRQLRVRAQLSRATPAASAWIPAWMKTDLSSILNARQEDPFMTLFDDEHRVTTSHAGDMQKSISTNLFAAIAI